MARILFAHPRLFDLATVDSGDWRAALPVTNVQDMQPSRVARTTNLSNTFLVVQFTAAVACTVAAFIATNLATGATIRIRGATSEANLTAAPGYDSTAVSAWPGTGRPTDAGLTTWSAIKVLSNSTAYVWWRIDFSDGSNPDGYIDIGRIILAPVEQTPITTARNYRWMPADVVVSSTFGPTLTQHRLKPRAIDVELVWMTEAEMFAGLADVARLRGFAGDIVCCLDPDATSLLHQYLLHGLISDVISFSNQRTSVFGARVSLLELV